MSRRQRRIMAQINVVPYIDVMLVLLVIFMVTAPLLQPGVINLPRVGQAAAVEQEPLEVVLASHGQLRLRDSKDSPPTPIPVELEQLAALLQSHGADERPVVISADGRVRYEDVMKVVDKLQRANITRIGLLVNTQAQ